MRFYLIGLGLSVLFSSVSPAQTARTALEKKALPRFDTTLDAPRVGKVRLQHNPEEIEPMTQPASFKISVRCDGRKKSEVVREVRAWELRSYEYNKVERKLYAKIIHAAIDESSVARPGESEDIEIDLAKFCEEIWHRGKSPATKPVSGESPPAAEAGGVSR